MGCALATPLVALWSVEAFYWGDSGSSLWVFWDGISL